jgi:LPS export ABC transporter protein LptC
MNNWFTHKNILRAAVITGCFFMCACENDVNEVKELGKRKPSIDEGRNIDSYLSMNGKMRAHLTAPLLLRFQGDSAKKAEFPNSLHVDFYNDSMKIESQLNAKYGQYLESENKIYLRDNVIAFNIKGDTLFCEDLYWDQAQERFYTNKRVTFSRGYRNTLIVGRDGMTSNQSFSDIKFFNIEPVSFTHVSDSATSTSATSPGATDTVKPKQ